MIKPSSLSWALLPLIFMMGCSGYSQLNRDLDDYRPPAYTLNSPSPESEKPEDPAKTDFEREKEQLEKAKALWQEALNSPRRETSFFTPPPGLQKALEPAATDGKAALEALSHPYSLETLETLALIRNPRIQGAKDDVRAALDTYTQVMALDDIVTAILGLHGGNDDRCGSHGGKGTHADAVSISGGFIAEGRNREPVGPGGF